KHWQSVPFIIEAGKALAESRVSITLFFKEGVTINLCNKCIDNPKELVIGIQPEEKIVVKVPHDGSVMEEMLADGGRNNPDAYEVLIRSVYLNDHSLFPSFEEIEASWKFVTPILEHFPSIPLHTYEKGSGGPNVDLQ